MLKECLELLQHEGATAVEIHTGEPVTVFLFDGKGKMARHCPAHPRRSAVIAEAMRKASEPLGAFSGPGVYHVTQSGCLTFIP